MNEKDLINYKPYFIKYDVFLGRVIYYDTSFYCPEDKIIHQNIKSALECKKCNKNRNYE